MTYPKGYLNDEEINRFLNACLTDRDRALFTLLSRTGRRVSEIIRSLKPKDVNWIECMVFFTILKRKEPVKRPIPVNKEAIDLLKKYVEAYNIDEDEHIFKINRHRVYQLTRSIAKRCGLEYVNGKPIHPHIFRHSFAVHIAKKIKDPAGLKKLQKLLGHSSIQITEYYLQFSPKDIQELVDKW